MNAKLNKKEINRYLDRIGFQGEVRPDLATLELLHKQHVENVPFENIDISLGNEITLSLKLQFDKVVNQQRGGFCYELNQTFAALLSACGYKVSFLSARVFFRGVYGPEFDHLLLLVECEGKQVVADVGFGKSFREPLPLSNNVVKQYDASYKIEHIDSEYTLLRKQQGSEWEPLYVFNLDQHKIEAFSDMLHFMQTSEDSHFTKETICTITTKSGRKTISGNRFIETIKDEKTERPIENKSFYRQLLKQHFYIELPKDITTKTWQRLGM